MKYVKILTDVIKYVNKKKKPSNEWTFGYYDNDLYFVYEKCAIYRIPLELNPFRENYLKENLGESNISSLMKLYSESNSLQKSGTQQLTNKIECNVFIDCKGNKEYIDMKLFKYSDFGSNTVCKSIGKNTPVYFSECKNKVDYILLPIKIKE